MTNRTPEKVADLIAEARRPWCKDCDHFIASLADALEDTVREMHARELHHFEEEQARAKAEAERDELRAVIAEVLVVPNEFEWDVPPTAKRILSRIPDTYGGAKPPNAEERARVRQLLSRIPEHPKED